MFDFCLTYISSTDRIPVWHAGGVTKSTGVIAHEHNHNLPRLGGAGTSGILAFSENVQHFVEPLTRTCHIASWLYDEFASSRIHGVDHVARAMGHYADGILSGTSRYVSARIPLTSDVFPTFTAPF